MNQEQNSAPQALLDAIVSQRETAMNQLAQATASNVVLGREIQRLSEEVERLKLLVPAPQEAGAAQGG